MLTSKVCTQCGNSLESADQFCTNCGAKIGLESQGDKTSQKSMSPVAENSAKSPLVTLLLCLFLGMFGIHRFYVGKFGTGLLMFLTGGGLGIWFLVDLILIVTNKFEDSEGKRLKLIKSPSSIAKAMLVIGSLIAWVLVFFGTIFAITLYITSGVVGSVSNQLAALRSGNIEKAYSYTSKDFQKATPPAKFKQFIDQYPSLKNNESSFFNNREINNNVGTVTGTLTAKDGAKTPVEYRLIWEDGSWKILNITVLPTGAGTEINYKHDSSN